MNALNLTHAANSKQLNCIDIFSSDPGLIQNTKYIDAVRVHAKPECCWTFTAPSQINVISSLLNSIINYVDLLPNLKSNVCCVVNVLVSVYWCVPLTLTQMLYFHICSTLIYCLIHSKADVNKYIQISMLVQDLWGAVAMLPATASVRVFIKHMLLFV